MNILTLETDARLICTQYRTTAVPGRPLDVICSTCQAASWRKATQCFLCRQAVARFGNLLCLRNNGFLALEGSLLWRLVDTGLSFDRLRNR